jgi:hypothetical protein
MPATHLESTRNVGKNAPRPRGWQPAGTRLLEQSPQATAMRGSSVAWVKNALQAKSSGRGGRFCAQLSAISGGGGPPGVDGGEVTVSMMRRSLAWIVGVLAVVMAGAAVPQGNIDAGKSPAQLFADTCSNCHRRPSELKRTSASFLRQHYTPGAQEASAMASYLSSVPQDPRAGKDRGKAAPPEKDRPKAAPQPPQQQAQERPPERPQDRPKAQPPNLKAKRPEIAKSAEPPAAEAPPAEVRVEAPPVPKLEPFEE